jgi:hypothetical protein
MMAEADKVAGQLGYTTSVSQEQGDPTDPTEFGFTWGYHIKVADGRH